MTDHFFKYYKVFLESGFVSRNKWLILFLLGGTAATGIQELRIWKGGYYEKQEVKVVSAPAAPVAPVPVIKKTIIKENCTPACSEMLKKHEQNWHGAKN